MKYDLVRPCPHCPFRRDRPGYLRPERAVQIAQALAEGSEFACHQTTEPDADGEDLVAGETSQFCAGALLMLEQQDSPNQIMRVAERLGIYDPAKLDRDSPVCRSTIEFAEIHGGDQSEPCCIANQGCEAPAGMLIGGVVAPAERTGETHECPTCGQDVCDNCTGDDGVTCVYCAGEDAD